MSTVNKTYSARTELMLVIACKNINLNDSGNQRLCGSENLNVFDQFANTDYQWHNNSGFCLDTSAMINVTINPNPTIDFGTLTSTHCENDGISPILNPIPANGTYSGAGISGTDFDPSLASVGAHTLYYAFSDGNVCSATDSLEVNVFAQPSTPSINNSFEILCVPGASAGSIYEWSLNGTVIVTGTDSCYAPTANGNSSVACTNSFGCMSDASAPSVVSGIGLDETNLEQFIHISPNPTDGIVTVLFEDQIFDVRISLLDLNGKILLASVSQSSTIIDLSIFDAGVYSLVLETRDQKFTKRVVRN